MFEKICPYKVEISGEYLCGKSQVVVACTDCEEQVNYINVKSTIKLPDNKTLEVLELTDGTCNYCIFSGFKKTSYGYYNGSKMQMIGYYTNLILDSRENKLIAKYADNTDIIIDSVHNADTSRSIIAQVNDKVIFNQKVKSVLHYELLEAMIEDELSK